MKNTDKESKKLKTLTYITLFISFSYSIIHILTMVLYYSPFPINDFTLTLDILSWFIYVPFVIISLIIQSLNIMGKIADTGTLKGCFYLPTFLNMIFGFISLYGIATLIGYAFQLIVS